MLNLYHMTAKIPYYENEIHMIENLVASLKETILRERICNEIVIAILYISLCV